jgi:hypothetical protein
MTEFIRGIRTPLSTIVMPASARIASNLGRVLPVAVPDQVLDLASGVVEVHDQVPVRLGDPRPGRVGGGGEDAYLAGGVLDDDQDVKSGAGQRHRLEEIGSDEGVGLRAQERRRATPGVSSSRSVRLPRRASTLSTAGSRLRSAPRLSATVGIARSAQ